MNYDPFPDWFIRANPDAVTWAKLILNAERPSPPYTPIPPPDPRPTDIYYILEENGNTIFMESGEPIEEEIGSPGQYLLTEDGYAIMTETGQDLLTG